jgi:hypothetical protein
MPHIDFLNDSKFFGRLRSTKLYAATEPDGVTHQNCEVILNPKTNWSTIPCTPCDTSIWNGRNIQVTNWSASEAADTFPVAADISGDLADSGGSPVPGFTVAYSGFYYGFNEDEIRKPIFWNLSTEGTCLSWFVHQKYDYWARYPSKDPVLVGTVERVTSETGEDIIGTAPDLVIGGMPTPPTGYNALRITAFAWKLVIDGLQITVTCYSDIGAEALIVTGPQFYWFGSRTLTSGSGSTVTYPGLSAGTPPGSDVVGGPATTPPVIAHAWRGNATCAQLANGNDIELDYNAGLSYGPKLGFGDKLRISFVQLTT